MNFANHAGVVADHSNAFPFNPGKVKFRAGIAEDNFLLSQLSEGCRHANQEPHPGHNPLFAFEKTIHWEKDMTAVTLEVS